jgi:hypothetical protein
MVASGMKDAGYQYVNIDDCWHGERDDRGEPAWSVDVDWSREHLEDTLSDRRARFGEVEYRIRDLWAGAELGTTATPLAGEVPGHDVWMLRLEPVDGGES